MQQKPEEISEYYSSERASRKIDYADPAYYRSDRLDLSDQSQAPSPSAGYASPASYYEPSSMNPYGNEVVSEYRGPADLEGYMADVGKEQAEAAERGTVEEGRKKRKGLAGIVGAVLALGAWLLKFNGLAFLLKFGWFGISALVSAALYSLLFGWPFAIGLIVLLFIHEMGHALVMKLKGIPVGAMVFIPLFGAAVTMQRMPQNARDEAEVGIAGPLAGAIASSACLLFAWQPGASPLWASLAYFGFFINLFNLVPVLPFDGGRVLAAIDRRVWILGFVGLLALQIWQWIEGNFSFWLLLLVIMAATQLWSRGFAPEEGQPSYYDVPVSTRIVMGLLYFGLAAVLFLGMSVAHSMLPLGG